MSRPDRRRGWESQRRRPETVSYASYYDELPHLCFPKQRFSKEVVDASGKWLWLRGEMRFISDKGGLSSLRITVLQRDVITFVYDGSRNFKVCIYSGSGGCEETRAVAQVIAVDDDDDYKEDSVCSLSSQDTNTSSEPETAQTVPSARNQEDSNIIEPEMAKTVPRTRNRGKKRAVVVQDSDESFISEDSNSMSDDSSYSPPNEDTLLDVAPKVTNSRKKGDLGSLNSNVGSTSNISRSELGRNTTIKNPQVYLDDPNNVCFETIVKNRIYELFQDNVWYIDNHENGTLEARATTWMYHRVVIKKWDRICIRNRLRKGDRLLCELFRKDGLVYAIKIHNVTTTTTEI
uniref:TF-B3 domain-containing protein n=1 Tax=Brassica oleracea TaxID=3712 RepID=A0A3P6C564_BRAOL|nr:unnamed protein product [Brassica oleracea]